MKDNQAPDIQDHFFADLAGKRALITGASSGLGAHFAKTLHAHGVTVGLAARRLGRLDDLAATLGDNAYPVTLDVTDPNSIAEGLDAFTQAAGGLPDIFINNAGIADPKGFLEASAEDTKMVFETNQTAVFNASQDIAKRWIAADRGGVIINISSIAGLRVMGGAAAYVASKAAVVHLTKVQAFELARYGIRVNAIAPGYFETEINSGFLKSDAGQKLINRIPMRKTGQPHDLDGLILLLSSDRSAYMTGSVIPIDGGHLTTSL